MDRDESIASSLPKISIPAVDGIQEGYKWELNGLHVSLWKTIGIEVIWNIVEERCEGSGEFLESIVYRQYHHNKITNIHFVLIKSPT